MITPRVPSPRPAPSQRPATFALRLELLEIRRQPGSIWTAGFDDLLGSLVLPLLESPTAASAGVVPGTDAKENVADWSPVSTRVAALPDPPALVPPAPAGGVAFPSESAARLSAVVLSLPGSGGPVLAKDDGQWFDLAPMPTARQEVSAAALGDEIFVIGGFGLDKNNTDTVEAYNVKTNTWRTVAPLPVVTDHSAAAVAAGTLYVMAGAPDTVFAYDAGAGAWVRVAPMAYSHGGSPAVAVIDDKIYVAGGYGPDMRENEVEVYDPAANVWTVLAPMQVPRDHTTGGAIDGKFYVAGGRGAAGSETAFEVYDPAADAWTFLPGLPTGRSGIGSGVVNGCLYVFGGEGERMFPEVELYDPATNAWRATTPMPVPRHGIWAATVGNAIFLPGGATQVGFGATDHHDVFVVG